MAKYKCFSCFEEIDPKVHLRKKVRCPYCGCKMAFKAVDKPTKVLAR